MRWVGLGDAMGVRGGMQQVRMRPARVFGRVMRLVKADKILLSYVGFLLVAAALLHAFEPQTFESYGRALWFLFETITTIGYGDVVPATTACRAITVIAGLSALVIVGLVTGIVVDYYTELNRLSNNESFLAFDERMRHVSQLSRGELEELQDEYVTFRQRRR